MSSEHPITPTPPPPDTDQPVAPPPDRDLSGPPPVAEVRSGRIWAFALGAGVLAGLLSAGVGEGIYDLFQPGLVEQEVMGEKNMVAPPHEIAAATRKNAALTFGLMAALLGLASGVAGGLAGRDGRSGVRAGLVGLAAGAIATALAAWLIVPVYEGYAFRVQSNAGDESLLLPLLVHAGIWAAAGAAGGLAFGLGLGDRRLALFTLIGGLVGAAIGAAIYEILGGILFPMDKTPQPFATSWMPRTLAPLLSCLLAAAGAAFAAQDALRARRKEEIKVPGADSP